MNIVGYTVVQRHDGPDCNSRPVPGQLQSMALASRREVRRVRRAGGILLPSRAQAVKLAEMWSGSAVGPRTWVRGEFSLKKKIIGQRIYVPSWEDRNEMGRVIA